MTQPTDVTMTPRDSAGFLSPTLDSRTATGFLSQPEQSSPVTQDTEAGQRDPSALDIGKAVWHRETLTGAIVQRFGRDEVGNGESADFNPYHYFAEHRTDLADIEPYLLSGKFDDAVNEGMFDQHVQDIRDSLANMDTIQAGGWKSLPVGMLASLLDVTTLVPFSGVTKLYGASRLANSGLTAAAIGGTQAAIEGGLHSLDDTRTLEESLANIGTAAALGGVFGALAPAFEHPASPLHPAHPNNPLRADAPVGDESVHIVPRFGSLDEAVTVTAADAAEGTRLADSVGAMRATGTDTELAVPDGSVGKLWSWFQQKMGSWTPQGRMFGYLPAGREAATKLSSLGGYITKGMLRGDALPRSAESEAELWRRRTAWTNDEVQRLYREANVSLGESRLGLGLKDELNDITLGKVDTAKLPGNWFSQSVLDLQHARRQMADGYGGAYFHARNKVVESARQRGLSDDQVTMVIGKVEKASEIVTKHFKEFGDAAVRSGLMDESMNMGEGYGAPVIYDAVGINAAPRRFGSIVFNQLAENPDPDWLSARGLDPAAFDKLPAAERDTVLHDWRGDHEDALAEHARMQLDAALAESKTLGEVAAVIAHGLRVATNERRAMTFKAAKAAVRQSEANWHGRQMARAINRLEKAETRLTSLAKSYPDIFDFADDIQAEFLRTGHSIDSVVEDLIGRRTAAAEERANLRSLRQDLVQSRPTLNDRDLRKATAEITAARTERAAADQALRDAQKALTAVAREQRQVGRWYSAVVQAIDESKTARELALDGPGFRKVQDADAERITQLKRVADDLEAVRREAVTTWRDVRKGNKLIQGELKKSMQAVRKGKTAMRKVDASIPLQVYTQQLITALRDHKAFPGGLLLDKAATSGRLKERKIKWSPELFQKLRDQGFVLDDLKTLTDRHQFGLSGRLGLQKAFGTQEREPLLERIASEYDNLIDQHHLRAETASPEARATLLRDAQRLAKIRDKNLYDVRAMWDRVLGTARLGGDADDFIVHAANNVRKAAFISMGGGFVFSALSDVVTASSAVRGFVRGFLPALRESAVIVKNAKNGDGGDELLAAALTSFETESHASASSYSYGAGGGGKPGGFGRTLDMMSDKVNIWSGLAPMTNALRRVSGTIQLRNLQKWCMDYDAVPTKVRAEMASLGIGEAEARLIGGFLKKHGVQEAPGRFNSHMDKWAGDAGREAVEAIQSAMIETQRRASYVPGVGTNPPLMDKWWGALLNQFQTYAFQFTNSFLLAGSQKMITLKDMRFAGHVITSFVLAALVAQIRAALREDDTAQWSGAKWTSELVTRSGILGWTQPYADTGVKLLGEQINDWTGMHLLEPSSKFAKNSAFESLLGPWLGVLGSGSKTAAALAQGDTTKAAENAFRFLALNQQIKALHILTQSTSNP